MKPRHILVNDPTTDQFPHITQIEPSLAVSGSTIVVDEALALVRDQVGRFERARAAAASSSPDPPCRE